MTYVRHMMVLLVMVILAACSGPSGTTVDGDGGPVGEIGGAGSSGMSDDGIREGSAFGEGMAGEGSLLGNRVIYFDFDRSDVLGDYSELLDAHGAYLADNPGARIRLEGHADERGSREYNIGLGERRAQAVRQRLMLNGASAVQLSTVSYGEERPAVLGSDEEAWALNRRVELVYAP